jgi:hypothetical protein
MSAHARIATGLAPPMSAASTAGVLQRKCACGNSSAIGGKCEECANGSLQRKLRVGATNDPLELEADRVAEHVMRAPLHAPVGASVLGIQRLSGPSSESTNSVPHSVERVLSSPGTSLEPQLRKNMEDRFGYDFSSVRVHADPIAQRSADDVNAIAYTVGRHIVFGASAVPTATRASQTLLAHELTHVVQQGGAQLNSPSQADTGVGSSGHRDASTTISSTGDGVVRGKWRLDRAMPAVGTEIEDSEDNGDTTSTTIGARPGSVYGDLSVSAITKQTQGYVKQKVGGRAQIARWMTTHFVFKNDGADQDFLQLKMFAQFGGNAKAEDLKYARAASVVWGGSVERTAANPTPSGKDLFQIKGGAISAATVGDLGEIEADISLGDKGSVKITIPLKKVEEGTFAPYADSVQPIHDVPPTVSEVDVQLGARVEADAEIRDDWFGIAPWISRNWNKAFANGIYLLNWESRPAPGARAVPAPETHESDRGAGVQPLGATYACAICKCQGDKECGGGRIHTIWMGKTECNRKNKAEAQRLCNHDRTFLNICDLDQKRKDGKKCSVHHHDFACGDRETEQKCINRRQ